MRQGGEPQGVQVVRQGEPTPYHCDFNSLYIADTSAKPKSSLHFSRFMKVQAAFAYGVFPSGQGCQQLLKRFFKLLQAVVLQARGQRFHVNAQLRRFRNPIGWVRKSPKMAALPMRI